VLASGSVLIYWTRPLEGSVLLAILMVMLPWRIQRNPSLQAWIVFVTIAISGAAWLGYYNFRVTGSALNLPQVEYERQYSSAPKLIFLPLGDVKQIRDPHLHLILNVWERNLVLEAKTLRGQAIRLGDVGAAATMFAGNHWLFLLPLMLFSPWVARDRRVRVLILSLCGGLALAQVEIAYNGHYAAPFCAAVVIVAIQGFRHLRVWRVGSRSLGRVLFPAILVLGTAAILLEEGRDWLVKERFGSFAFAAAAGRRKSLEESLPAERRHVILVRYDEPYQLHVHWVYNHANIDGSRVVWAHDLGPLENKQLLAYYPDRQFWLLRPNRDPTWLEPYPR